MKILLVGHGCQPNVGSEPGLTWNWAEQLSRRNTVWVLAHPHARALVEQHTRSHPNPNLNFAWVELPRWLDPWNPKSGEKHLRLHYLLWQRQAYRIAKRLNDQHHFDVVHHVGWSTVASQPPYWKIPTAFVWGPLGGGQTVPPQFASDMGSDWKWERFRGIRLLLSPLILHKAARKSAMVLATNLETAKVLERAGATNVKLFLDNGVAPAELPKQPQCRPVGDTLRIIWAGRLEKRKALPLLLEALQQVEPEYQVHLEVAGSGPELAAWKALAAELSLEKRVTFLGWVDRNQLRSRLRDADVFAFTSIRDGFGSVVLEAMAQSLPVICLDHQGVRCFVPPEAGVKVPVSTRSGTIAGLAQAIRVLATDDTRRAAMGRAAWECAVVHSWDNRGEEMERWYSAIAGETQLTEQYSEVVG